MIDRELLTDMGFVNLDLDGHSWDHEVWVYPPLGAGVFWVHFGVDPGRYLYQLSDHVRADTIPRGDFFAAFLKVIREGRPQGDQQVPASTGKRHPVTGEGPPEACIGGLARLIRNCPGCQGYGSRPPIPMGSFVAATPDGTRCVVCGPVRDWLRGAYGIEFECLT